MNVKVFVMIMEVNAYSSSEKAFRVEDDNMTISE